MERSIVWNKLPSKYLARQLKHISKESYQNAELVENAILASLESTKEQPEKYPSDKLKKTIKVIIGPLKPIVTK